MDYKLELCKIMNNMVWTKIELQEVLGDVSVEKLGTNLLEINKKLQFINNRINFYEGTIVKLYEKCLGVQIPTEQPNFKIIEAADDVDFFLVYDETAYWCKSKVLGCKVEDKNQIILLGEPEVVNKIERRQYKRLQTIMDIEYLLLPEGINGIQDISPILLKQMRKTFTIDISGGGVSLITYQQLEEEKNVLLSFQLEDEKMIILSEVVRSLRNEKNDNYKTALKFKDIADEKRQGIIDFIHMKSIKGK